MKSLSIKNNGLLADAVDDLTFSKSENSLENGCSYINVRPTAYQCAMIDTIAKLKGKNSMALIRDDFSSVLAELVLLSPSFIPAVQKVISEKGESAFRSGAVKVLEEAGVIRRGYPGLDDLLGAGKPQPVIAESGHEQ